MLSGPCLKTAALFFLVPFFGEGRVFCSPDENGRAFAKNVELYQKGGYKEAMLGFMELLVKEPGNAAVMQNLRSAGVMLQKQEKKAEAQEKDNLIREAGLMETGRKRLEKNKRLRLKRWKESCSRVLKLASSPETLKAAVREYESFLKSAPVYAEAYERFTLNNGAIKKRFYKTMKRSYPLWVEDKVSVDARDLATLFFAESTATDSPSRYVNSQGTEQMLNKVQEIEELEKETENSYKTAAEALRLYSNAKYEASLGFWKRLLAREQSNEEAIFYRDLAEKNIRAAASAMPEAQRLYERGVSEFAAGNYAAAVKNWRDSARLEPGNKKTELCIGEALRLMRKDGPAHEGPGGE